MLQPQRRHRRPCKRKMWDAGYTRCACPIVIRGTIAGKFISLSPSKYLPRADARNLDAARELALLWEQRGRVVHPEPPGRQSVTTNPQPDGVTVEHAVQAYLSDSLDRGNGEAAMYKKVGIFERRFKTNPRDKAGPKIPIEGSSLLGYCARQGIRFLDELTLPVIIDWRASWKVNALVRLKRQGTVLGFFWFCERLGWYPRNYASDITRGLGKIRIKPTETGYFLPEEYSQIINATFLYSDRPSIDRHTAPALTLGGDRIRALTELMRWSGLRIRDAVTLERSRVSFDSRTGFWTVMLYQKKTGDPVYCPLPPHVADLLRSVPPSQKGNTNEKYFFWTGNGLPKTIVSNWQRSYSKLFKLAGISKRCHPHMFRDTFAVEAILSDMPVQRVSEILGHTSVKTTEKHYLPWVRARQAHLNEAVVASWKKQGVYERTPTVKKLG